MDRVTQSKIGLRAYGYMGLAIIVVAEILMFFQVQPVFTYFTPIVWSGYILFVDSIIHKIHGRSMIRHRRREFLFMLFVSLVFWLVFEAYNLHMKNWHYIGLPQQLWATCLGFSWAFATILPAILLTARLLEVLGFPRVRMPKIKIGPAVYRILLPLGLLCLTIPVLLPFAIARYLIILIWLGFIFLLDPITSFRRGWSLLQDLGRGDLSRWLVLFTSGIICGLLWEFWNYWAGAKWIYTIPLPLGPKIFQMPIGGYLGFLPFAVECHVLYALVMSFRTGGWSQEREV